jgi:hypothetical protein
MQDQPTDPAQEAWFHVMRRLALLMIERNFAAALSEVQTFLGGEVGHEWRAEALAFRGDIKEEMGDLRGAKLDFSAARSLVGPGYAKYVHEISLAGICRKQQLIDEAISWYRAAMHTAIEVDKISSGSALSGLLKLQSQAELTTEDREICVRAAKQSWRVLGLPGSPDISGLEKVASLICKAETKPPRPSAQ